MIYSINPILVVLYMIYSINPLHDILYSFSDADIITKFHENRTKLTILFKPYALFPPSPMGLKLGTLN